MLWSGIDRLNRVSEEVGVRRPIARLFKSSTSGTFILESISLSFRGAYRKAERAPHPVEGATAKLSGMGKLCYLNPL